MFGPGEVKSVSEQPSTSWIQSNWRPILMLTITAIIANNYLIFPYVALITGKAAVLQLPEKLYDLMTVGVGGYIVARSAEKGIAIWKNGRAAAPKA
jgi:Holin of 3TMs, for gene-transfer release